MGPSRAGGPMRQSPYAWSRAYARQAQADLDAREALLGAAVPACQHLHFLQMACEKISKAHRCLGGADPETLTHSHGFAAKVLPQIARELLRRRDFAADLSVAHRGIRDDDQAARSGGRLACPCRRRRRPSAGQLRVSLGRRRGVFMCRPSTGSHPLERCTGIVRGRPFLRSWPAAAELGDGSDAAS